VTEAWIALGSNLGVREEHLRYAIERLQLLGKLTKISSIHETEPAGYRDQGRFLNAVLSLEVELTAHRLLDELLLIETGRGRIRDERLRNGPRTLDLDLLLYGDSVIAGGRLTVPHPRMHLRRFVLAPLAEIAPGLIHPVLRKTTLELLAALP
jgi:2-amino-4-hydroxy-6-hydroxymethyldihydropteridine diphosphokinase